MDKSSEEEAVTSSSSSGFRRGFQLPTLLLPPIEFADSSSSSGSDDTNNKSTKNEDKHCSRYQRGRGATESIYMDWNSVKSDKKSTGAIPKRSMKKKPASSKDLGAQEMFEQLEKNKEFLDSYIYERVPVEMIEKWLQEKTQRMFFMAPPSPNYKELGARKRPERADKSSYKNHFMELLKTIHIDSNEHTVLWELAKYIVNAVGVDAYKVYKLYPDHPGFVHVFVDDYGSNREKISVALIRADEDEIGQVLEVAKSGTCRRLSRFQHPVIFPPTPVRLFKSFNKMIKQANHILYVPTLSETGNTIYVVEMWRIHEEFQVLDELTASNFLVLGSLILNYCHLYLEKKKETIMSDFLLEVVKAIFEKMVSLDPLIKRILEFAQRLVNADRASLFLVDHKNFELVSTVFDLKYEPGQDRDMEKKKIRIPINRGIAGHVALSGQPLNIPDAYSDYRFNREVDEATGYKTQNILCMPVKAEGRIIGVVQMVNKRNKDYFPHEDQVAFEIFSTLFGLALHNAKLYDRILRKEQKYKVALEVLSYHNTCKEEEVIATMRDNRPINVNLNDFYLNPYECDEIQKCKCVIEMFNNLFGLEQFKISTLTRFVLTVKKNYRNVPYHNFDHGWAVAHSMYVILKTDDRERFDYKMRLALFVACLCHDLDHRGYTNKYMSEIASPLAAMYTTSALEHHHFNITVNILQQDGHNIFSNITSEDYKDILSYMKHCILATDLAAFFPNMANMNQLLEGNMIQFDWMLSSHKELAMACVMTACDLSAATKPWKIQLRTVHVIFDEFYEQGDRERASGFIPVPMMDRRRPDKQPSTQVDFLSQICLPCYNILYKILPNTEPMRTMVLQNLDRWKAKAERIVQSRECREIRVAVCEPESNSDANAIEECSEAAGIINDLAQDSALINDLPGHSSWIKEKLITEAAMDSWIDEDGVVMFQRNLKDIEECSEAAGIINDLAQDSAIINDLPGHSSWIKEKLITEAAMDSWIDEDGVVMFQRNLKDIEECSEAAGIINDLAQDSAIINDLPGHSSWIEEKLITEAAMDSWINEDGVVMFQRNLKDIFDDDDD